MFIPINRYLLVEQEEQQEENQSTILIPDIVAKMSDFSLVKLFAVAPDCEKFNGEVGQTLVVNTKMIESVKIKDEEFSIILENHVIGLVAGE